MTADRSIPPPRYHVVKDCAAELIRLAHSDDIETRSAVEVLHDRVPAATGREMRMAVEVALECVMATDEDDEDGP